jgi:thymidylate synthase (FAD)
MNVRIIWITPNAENLIAYIARVSSPDNQDNPDYTKLIKYLIRNKHWSPFEQVDACFEIKTSRAIAQQLLRHRSFSFQELSQRYSQVTELEPIELRKQSVKNRQSSEEVFNPELDIGDFKLPFSELIEETLNQNLWLYNHLITAGVAKECARFVLPLTTQTTMYMKGSLRSWIHYLALRTDIHTQKEHRLIAEQIELELRLYFPTVFEALDQLSKEQKDNELLLKLLTSEMRQSLLTTHNALQAL